MSRKAREAVARKIRKKVRMVSYSPRVPRLKPGPRTLAKQKETALKEPLFDYSIALLLDTSGSMEGEKIKDAKEALISFLIDVSLTENEVGLATFGEGVRTDRLSQSGSYLEQKIRGMRAGGGTPMRAGIKAAYEKILKKGKGSLVMLIATDGQPTDASEEEILRYTDPIKKDGIRIITIGIGKDVNEEFLKRLASSPEDYHFAKASFELKKIYKKVAAGLAVREKNA